MFSFFKSKSDKEQPAQSQQSAHVPPAQSVPQQQVQPPPMQQQVPPMQPLPQQQMQQVPQQDLQPPPMQQMPQQQPILQQQAQVPPMQQLPQMTQIPDHSMRRIPPSMRGTRRVTTRSPFVAGPYMQPAPPFRNAGIGGFVIPRTPLIHPKGYVPKAGAANPNAYSGPLPKDMLRSAVQFFSPAVYHPGEPGKNLSQNVVSVELGSLSRPVDLATGDPVRCKQCQAVFCASDAPGLTKVEKKDDAKMGEGEAGDDDDDEPTGRIWTCRYCGCKQEIDIDDAEIPTGVVSEYVLAPGEEPEAGAAVAAGGEAAVAAGADAADDGYVVFCVDVSGSMSMTTCVDGSHISKLACVANAVYTQMDALRHEHPNRRVCLITFGNDVDIFDGEKHSTVHGPTLNEWDSIVKFAEGVEINKSVSEVFDALAEQVIYMEERGCTALGPALLMSINIASRKRGSYVVLCTDGMANQGIGSLEGLSAMVEKEKDDSKKSDVELLYERFGSTARDAGVTVSVIGIKGTRCALENLGVVADASGGNVELVDPSNVDFAEAIEEPVIATRVQVALRVDPSLIFENGSNSITADIGNVKRITQQQCALFSSTDDKVKPPSEVVMQCEITFTMTNGAVHLRVIEKTVPFKDDLREAVDGINVQLVGGYVSRRAAQMAHDGDVENAGIFSQGYQDLLHQYLRMQRSVNQEQQMMMDRFCTQNVRAQTLVRTSVTDQRRRGLSSMQQARTRSDEESLGIYQMRSDRGAAECIVM